MLPLKVFVTRNKTFEELTERSKWQRFTNQHTATKEAWLLFSIKLVRERESKTHMDQAGSNLGPSNY